MKVSTPGLVFSPDASKFLRSRCSFSYTTVAVKLLSTGKNLQRKKYLKPLLWPLEMHRGFKFFTRYAEGETRTPMPIKAQRPERCVSTISPLRLSVNDIILLYLLRLVNTFCGPFLKLIYALIRTSLILFYGEERDIIRVSTPIG
jgi:hypothetical protein